MENSAHVLEVGADDFDRSVLERSRQVPVLVDFWAPWCGPCRTLGPVLEKLAAEMDGAFVLAKVNSDEHPELASRHGVQGIPNVQLFRDGKAVDRFVGALPESQVRAFLRRHCPSPADELVAAAERQLAAGDARSARKALEQALELDPDSASARLALARTELAAGAPAAARRQLEAIPARTEEADLAEDLLQVVALAEEAVAVGDAASCEARLGEDPADLEARYALAGHALAAGHHRRALESYLEVARADRSWRDQAARKAMVKAFRAIGVRHPLSDEFRDLLAPIYY